MAVAQAFVYVFGTFRALFLLKEWWATDVFWGVMALWICIAWAIAMWAFDHWYWQGRTE